MSASMQDRYRAILGEKNCIYYLTKFESFDKLGMGLMAGWNWAAFLSGGLWPLYRKMYGWFFAIWGTFFLSNVFEKVGFPGISVIIGLVPWIAFSIYADSLYHNNIKKKIAFAQLTLKDEPRLLEYLRYKGGVHMWIWVFVALPIIGIVAAVLIPMFAREDSATTTNTIPQASPTSSPATENAAESNIVDDFDKYLAEAGAKEQLINPRTEEVIWKKIDPSVDGAGTQDSKSWTNPVTRKSFDLPNGWTSRCMGNPIRGEYCVLKNTKGKKVELAIDAGTEAQSAPDMGTYIKDWRRQATKYKLTKIDSEGGSPWQVEGSRLIDSKRQTVGVTFIQQKNIFIRLTEINPQNSTQKDVDQGSELGMKLSSSFD